MVSARAHIRSTKSTKASRIFRRLVWGTWLWLRLGDAGERGEIEASEEDSSSGSSSYEVVEVLTRYRDKASREAPIDARIRPRTCRVRPGKGKFCVEVVDRIHVTICKDLGRVASQKAGGNGQGDQGVWSQRGHCEAAFRVFLLLSVSKVL
jgi:hypothetical protein